MTPTSQTPTTTVTIPAGTTSATVDYLDTASGSPVVTATDLALSSAPTQQETITPLPASLIAFTNPPLDIVQGTFGQMTITLEDSSGNPAPSTSNQTISLSTTSVTGSFYLVEGQSAVADVTIPAGSTSITLFYSDSSPGTPTLSASDGVFTSAPRREQATVTPVPASQVAITSAGLNLIAGTRTELTVELENPAGNPAVSASSQTIGLGTTSGAGAFYASATSKTPITSLVIPAGQSSPVSTTSTPGRAARA